MNKHRPLQTLSHIHILVGCQRKLPHEKLDEKTLATIDDWSSSMCSCAGMLGEDSTTITAAQNCVNRFDNELKAKAFKWPSSVNLNDKDSAALAQAEDPGQACRRRVLNPHGL